MRYLTLFLGLLSITVVSIVHFYPDEVTNFIDDKS